MKGTIVQIFPSLPGMEQTEVARVKIGLSEGKLVGIPSGEHRVGDEISLNYNFVGPESEGTLWAMALDLQKKGKFQFANSTQQGRPLAYVPSEGLLDFEGAYLQRIWRLMDALGATQVTSDGISYTLNIPTEDYKAYDIFELGYVISDYYWKLSHEEAARAEYRAKENRMNGVRAGTGAVQLRARERRNLIAGHAEDLLAQRPSLKTNLSKLAVEVLSKENKDSLSAGQESELPIKPQRVRKVLRELIDKGRI